MAAPDDTSMLIDDTSMLIAVQRMNASPPFLPKKWRASMNQGARQESGLIDFIA
jgi:hypothetical protein